MNCREKEQEKRKGIKNNRDVLCTCTNSPQRIVVMYCENKSERTTEKMIYELREIYNAMCLPWRHHTK